MSAALDMAAAVQVWHRTFHSTDPFGWPFAPTLGCGRVLFPIDGCHLSREQFDALREMAAQVGEAHCYLAVVEGSASGGITTNDEIFVIDLEDYDGYARLHLTLENTLYSMSGGWGLMLSHEMHAVLGSSAELISAFNRFDRLEMEQWEDFQAQWKGEEHAKWLAEIALHIPH